MEATLLLMLIVITGNGQITKSGAAGDQTTSEIRQQVIVWAAPAEQKIRPDDEPESNNLVWSKEEKKNKNRGSG